MQDAFAKGSQSAIIFNCHDCSKTVRTYFPIRYTVKQSMKFNQQKFIAAVDNNTNNNVIHRLDS